MNAPPLSRRHGTFGSPDPTSAEEDDAVKTTLTCSSASRLLLQRCLYRTACFRSHLQLVELLLHRVKLSGSSSPGPRLLVQMGLDERAKKGRSVCTPRSKNHLCNSATSRSIPTFSRDDGRRTFRRSNVDSELGTEGPLERCDPC